jgi:hypothetical protein
LDEKVFFDDFDNKQKKICDEDGDGNIPDDNLPQSIVQSEIEKLLELAASYSDLLEAVLDKRTFVVHVEYDIVLLQLVIHLENPEQFLNQRLSFHVVLSLVFHILY